jgi:phosphatidylinositol alpha-1,6-mannosyltransferase
VKVLLITPDFAPVTGGIQTLLHRLVVHATRLEMRVVTMSHTHASIVDDGLAAPVHRVGAPAGVHSAGVAALNAQALRVGLRHRPDVVLSGHIVCAPAALALRRPVVQYTYAKELGARPRLAKAACARATRTIAISSHTARLVQEVGTPAERIVRIPPGVDLPDHEASTAPDEPLITTVARLEDRYKGCDILIAALPVVRRHVPNARLAVIGEGSMRPWLESLAESTGMENAVTFHGALSDDERDAALARTSVLAMPSRLPPNGFGGEGFGIVYLEAGARGIPVIAANVGGATDAVVHGETGLLVDPTDHLAVADAIVRILTDPVLAHRLRAGARPWAERFAWPAIARRVEDVLMHAAGSL